MTDEKVFHSKPTPEWIPDRRDLSSRAFWNGGPHRKCRTLFYHSADTPKPHLSATERRCYARVLQLEIGARDESSGLRAFGWLVVAVRLIVKAGYTPYPETGWIDSCESRSSCNAHMSATRPLTLLTDFWISKNVFPAEEKNTVPPSLDDCILPVEGRSMTAQMHP